MPTDIAEDVLAFIAFFREQRLDWIADQLVSVIQEGQSEAKRIKKIKRKGITTRPFAREEQEKILLDLIEAYFVVLPRLLPAAEKALNEAVAGQRTSPKPPSSGNQGEMFVTARPGDTVAPRNTTIVLRDLEADVDYVPYTADLAADTAKLERLITAARQRVSEQ